MVITLESDLETALVEEARQRGVAPQALALRALRDRFLGFGQRDEPRDEWERRLRRVATDCGLTLSNTALSSEGIYD